MDLGVVGARWTSGSAVPVGPRGWGGSGPIIARGRSLTGLSVSHNTATPRLTPSFIPLHTRHTAYEFAIYTAMKEVQKAKQRRIIKPKVKNPDR